MTSEELKKMAEADIREVDPDELVDISEIEIRTDLPQEDRIQDYLEQIKNPYLFKVNGIAVKITFAGKRRMQDCLQECLFGQE